MTPNPSSTGAARPRQRGGGL